MLEIISNFNFYLNLFIFPPGSTAHLFVRPFRHIGEFIALIPGDIEPVDVSTAGAAAHARPVRGNAARRGQIRPRAGQRIRARAPGEGWFGLFACYFFTPPQIIILLKSLLHSLRCKEKRDEADGMRNGGTAWAEGEGGGEEKR